MSKILYVCIKNSKSNIFTEKNIELLSRSLEPDNISFRPAKVVLRDSIILALFNPSQPINIKDTSIYLGNIIDSDSRWWEPLEKIPDGSRSIFRSNKSFVEIISDTVGYRTIWYFFNDDFLIASTSQRSIIFFLRSFEFNDKVLPWILSTGTLGPENSWDKRINILNNDSNLILDRRSWKLKINSRDQKFHSVKKPEKEFEIELTDALENVFDSLDYSNWALPLSGGYDSRSILCLLKNRQNLLCVTWGVKKSQFEDNNDAFIAKKLAGHYNVEHKYYFTDISDEPIENIFNRYFMCGEGRTDHISGYMDGFKIWKTLYEEGIEGIIRGDEGFGRLPVWTPLDVRLMNGFPLMSDFSNLKPLEEFGIKPQKLPSWLQQEKGESLETWRDRTYQQFRTPYVLAALNDLKLSYVEVISPFLTRRILSIVREMPDKLRTDKKLFKKIVDSLSPDIIYAKRVAIDKSENILRNANIINVIKNTLYNECPGSLIPTDFIKFVLKELDNAQMNSVRSIEYPKNYLKKLLPNVVKKKLKNTLYKPKLNINILAFRIYTICMMYKILNVDAKKLK